MADTPNFIPWAKREAQDDYQNGDVLTRSEIHKRWAQDTLEEFNAKGAWNADTLTKFNLMNRKVQSDIFGDGLTAEQAVQELLADSEQRSEGISRVMEGFSFIEGRKGDIRLERRRRDLTLATNAFAKGSSLGLLRPYEHEVKAPENQAQARIDRDVKRLGEISRKEAEFTEVELLDAKEASETLSGKRDSAFIKGRVLVNPHLYFLDKEDFLQAVNNTPLATEEAKAEAIAEYDMQRERLAEDQWEPLLMVPSFRKIWEEDPEQGKAEAVEKWAANSN